MFQDSRDESKVSQVSNKQAEQKFSFKSQENSWRPLVGAQTEVALRGNLHRSLGENSRRDNREVKHLFHGTLNKNDHITHALGLPPSSPPEQKYIFENYKHKYWHQHPTAVKTKLFLPFVVEIKTVVRQNKYCQRWALSHSNDCSYYNQKQRPTAWLT